MKHVPKILVVEDIKIAQKMAMMTLTQLGCYVDTADNGTVAIELVKKNDYDLIFMDLGLPDIDGVTVAETIRKIEQGAQHVPIVALTANAEATYKSHCLDAGMDDFILKPLNKENSQKMIAKFVKGRHGS